VYDGMAHLADMIVYDQSTKNEQGSMGRPSTARTRLLDTARDLIHSRSYASASVDDLCAAAGINKGSFYYFFPSKRELVLSVLDEQWERTRTNVLDPAFAADVPPLERIDRFFRRVTEIHRVPVVLGCPFGNLALELSTMEEPVRDKVRAIFDGYRGYFERALTDAVAAGALGPADVQDTAQALVAYFQGALVLAKTHNDAGVIAHLATHARALIGAAPIQRQHQEQHEESIG
jgi:TetR/AcrR family transcriptional regulator, transcriptional repressor for nem operon